MAQFNISVYDSNGVQKTAVSTVPATSITGQVATGNGGTGQNWSASSGIPKLTAGAASLVTAPSGALVGDTDTQTLTNKSLQDSTTYFVDDSDATKKAQLQLSGVTTATTRILTVPDVDITLVGTDATQTLTNKTITAPAISAGVFTGANDFNAATVRVPVSAAALVATQGYWKWDSTDKIFKVYDGTRERGASWAGYIPFAHHSDMDNAMTFTGASTLAANGGTSLIPIPVTGQMVLESVSFWNVDTATARTWGWDLYVDRMNTGSSLDRVAQCSASQNFTPTVAARRVLTASANTDLAPGMYYLALQNRHASSTLGVGVQASGATGSVTTFKTKTLTNPNGATLDPVTATWAQGLGAPSPVLNGQVAGSAWSV